MKLISLRNQNLDGSRKLVVGEVFEMSESTGAFLIKTNRAKLYEEPEKKKGAYKRRDMRAES